MSHSDDSSRRYGDREVGLILKRATELQDTAPEPSGAGLSLEELEEIALEAGIDPSHLRRAATEVESGASSSSLATAFLGTSPTVSMERVIRGEIAEDVFEILLPEIQRLDTGQGVPSLFGRTLTWRSNTPSNTRSLQVTVSSRDGETQIRIEEQLHGLAGGLFGGLLGGGGGGIGIGVGVGVGVDVLGSVLVQRRLSPWRDRGMLPDRPLHLRGHGTAQAADAPQPDGAALRDRGEGDHRGGR